MVIVYPIEGLANRMRVIDSAYRYCSKTNQKLLISWKKDDKLSAYFSDLYNSQEFIKKDKTYAMFKLLVKFVRRFKLVSSILSILESRGIVKIFLAGQYEELIEYVYDEKRHRLLIIESYSRFYCEDNEPFMGNLFVPVKEISDRIEKTAKEFSNNTIGVHIRRTDNLLAIKYSPIVLFVSKIKSIVEHNPSSKFYLCSDDKEIKRQIVDCFGSDIILTTEGPLERNSIEGIKMAVVEMFLLSKTRYIIGTYYSSFGEIASQLSNIRLNVLSNQ